MKKLILLALGLTSGTLFAQSCFSSGDGTDGGYIASSNTTLAGGTYNFSSFTINPGVTVSVTGAAPLVIYCTGAVTIDGVLAANGGNGANGVTYTNGGIGGIGVAGGGNGGDGSFASGSGPLPGLDGDNTGGVGNAGGAWSGGGGAGYAAAGGVSGNPSGGFAGPVYGTADLSGMLSGSGGGGGSGGYDCGAGGGGAGGGLIVINGNSIVISAVGAIQCNGGNGGSDDAGNCGGGGGGSGGSIWIASPSITNDGAISATGGTGGASNVSGNPYYGIGGNGSEGRIRIDVTGSVNGSGGITPVAGLVSSILSVTQGTIISSCSGSTDGSATVVPSGGTGPYTYLWSIGDTTNTINNLAPGTYDCVVTDQAGCEVTVNSIVVPALSTSSFSQTVSMCNGESYTVGANTYIASGSYLDTLTNAVGCDSIITTNLTVLPALSSSQTVSICAGETFTVGDSTYSTNGTHVTTLTSVIGGCDSTVTTNLTVAAALDVNLTINQGVLQVAESGATYQWLDCDNNNIPISLATSQNYTPTVNGIYAVEVTENGCTDTSDCQNYNLIGLAENPVSSVTLYPNPTTDQFTLLLNGVAVSRISVVDATGRMVMEIDEVSGNELTLDLKNEQTGLYFVQLQVGNDLQTLRVIKE
ncbi:MAG: T9SS type A sorting domain-containing protein [Bacteroidota bacterium]